MVVNLENHHIESFSILKIPGLQYSKQTLADMARYLKNNANIWQESEQNICTPDRVFILPDTQDVIILPDTQDVITLLYRKEMFHLTTHSTHFIYDYMVSDIR